MKKIVPVAMILGLAGIDLGASRATAAQSPVVEAVNDAKANAQLQQAKADLMSMSSALKMFKLHAGVYPMAEQGLVSLVEKPVKDPVPRRWVQVIAQLPKDPWGRDYRYLTRKKDDQILHIVVCGGPDPISEKDNLEEVLEEPKKQ